MLYFDSLNAVLLRYFYDPVMDYCEAIFYFT